MVSLLVLKWPPLRSKSSQDGPAASIFENSQSSEIGLEAPCLGQDSREVLGGAISVS
jgi:hypothetical protein